MWELRWRKKKHKKHINSILDVFPPIYNLMVQIHKIISICKLCISYNMFIQHQQKKKKRRKMFTTRYTHAFPLHHRQTTFILFFLVFYFAWACFSFLNVLLQLDEREHVNYASKQNESNERKTFPKCMYKVSYFTHSNVLPLK